jgi:hypothetical protein
MRVPLVNVRALLRRSMPEPPIHTYSAITASACAAALNVSPSSYGSVFMLPNMATEAELSKEARRDIRVKRAKVLQKRSGEGKLGVLRPPVCNSAESAHAGMRRRLHRNSPGRSRIDGSAHRGAAPTPTPALRGRTFWPEQAADQSPDATRHSVRVHVPCPFSSNIVIHGKRMRMTPEESQFGFAFPVSFQLARPSVSSASPLRERSTINSAQRAIARLSRGDICHASQNNQA